MIRVEKNPEPMVSRESVQKEIKRQVVKQRSRKQKRFVGCLAIFLLILILLGVAVGWMVSRTGLVDVPVFSRYYEVPEPTREVTAGQGLEEYINELLAERLQRKVFEDPTDKSINLMIPEEVFTAGIQQVIADEKAEDRFVLERSQIVIEPEFGIEVFMPFTGNDGKSALILYVMPKVEDDYFSIKITGLKIGQLAVPGVLANVMFERPLDLLIDQLNRLISQYARFTSMTIESGTTTYYGELLIDINTILIDLEP